MTAYWLVKSEPGVFSWSDQVAAGVEPWTGVRSHQAKRNLESMRQGDLAFFYHSNQGKEIVGIVEIVREAYADPTASSGGWVSVDVRAGASLPHPVTLAALRSDPDFADLALVRLSRLSVSPVSAEHWKHILQLGGLPRGALPRGG